MIEKNGRRYAVLLGYEEYERLLALENTYWASAAARAEANGYVGTDQARKLLDAK